MTYIKYLYPINSLIMHSKYLIYSSVDWGKLKYEESIIKILFRELFKSTHSDYSFFFKSIAFHVKTEIKFQRIRKHTQWHAFEISRLMFHNPSLFVVISTRGMQIISGKYFVFSIRLFLSNSLNVSVFLQICKYARFGGV